MLKALRGRCHDKVILYTPFFGVAVSLWGTKNHSDFSSSLSPERDCSFLPYIERFERSKLAYAAVLTSLEPHSRTGDKTLQIRVKCR